MQGVLGGLNRCAATLLLALVSALPGFAGAAAQQLPPAPERLGTVSRAANGEIVAAPAPQPRVPAVAAPAGRPVATGTPAPVSGPLPSAPPSCAARAVTCFEAASGEGRAQSRVPVTVGQPFRAGDVPKGRALVARDSRGRDLPLQLDQPATFPDGSLRFAVLSTVLPDLPAHGREVVSLFLGEPAPGGAVLPVPKVNVKAVADLFAAQVSLVTFGNRDGGTPGIPFQPGETVTLVLGDGAGERHTLTISADLAGGAHPTLTRIAETFMALVNRGQTYRAYKLGEGGGYEKLWITTREQPGRPFPVRFIYAGRARIDVKTLQEWRPVRRYVASAGKGDAADVWLAGPVASEVVRSVPFVEEGSGVPHPQLTARFAIRAYAGSAAVRVDTTVENAWTYEPGSGNLSYDMAVLLDGSERFRVRVPSHHHHARWHRVQWTDAAPVLHVRHHAPYLFASRAVWNYDNRLGVPETALAAEERALAAADTGPMGAATVTPYMPMTGGRGDIGPLPRWTALHLLTQDRRAKAIMLANADAGGSAPIHFRDRKTDQPVSLDEHPDVVLRPNEPGPDAIPSMAYDETPWSPDLAHQPSLAYVPYLVTGDRYYLDELMFWANWSIGRERPEYRGRGLGLVSNEQIRGQAWGLRALGEAAHALPDRHPLKPYFARKLVTNLDWYVRHFPRNPDRNAVSPLGWVEKGDERGLTAPWQNDFLAVVLGWLADGGEPLADEYLRWLSRATVGRWTQEAQGYCRAQAPAYYIKIRGSDDRFVTDWKSLHRLNWPDVRGCPAAVTEGYPESPAGYVAVSLAMLAVAADRGIEGAAAAYERLRRETPALATAAAGDPTWAIVPRQTIIPGGPHGMDAAVQ